MRETGSICLEESLPESVETVYAAWTRPSMLKAWFRLAEGDRLLEAWTDPHPGGAYHLNLQQHNGLRVDYRGIYREVMPAQRLCLSWAAYGQGRLETELELDLAPDGRGTLLVLLHDGLLDRKMERECRSGWEYALRSLARELPGIRQRH